MSQPAQPLEPGWADEQHAKDESKRRCYRVSAADTERSRRRGARKALHNRWALRGLPPIEEDDPL